MGFRFAALADVTRAASGGVRHGQTLGLKSFTRRSQEVEEVFCDIPQPRLGQIISSGLR